MDCNGIGVDVVFGLTLVGIKAMVDQESMAKQAKLQSVKPIYKGTLISFFSWYSTVYSTPPSFA